MSSVSRVYDPDPEVSMSLMHPNCDFYDLSIGLFIRSDCEAVGVEAAIFSARTRCIPDQAFQPLVVDEASMLGDRVLIDSWIHVYGLEFSFLRKGPHLLFP
jgi:hypothetical protein